VLNLGLLFAQEGAVDEAIPHLRSAEGKGFPEASWAIDRHRAPSLPRGMREVDRRSVVVGGRRGVLRDSLDQPGANGVKL
jgi:hypothetical protein